MIRVLVVEDSLTVRKRLVEVLAESSEFEVVAEAENGKQAIELTPKLAPDVIMMDMMLPVMSGLAATEWIMAHHPTPILIVSSSTNRGELFKTYEALAAGAVDVLEKPHGDEGDGVWEAKLLSTLRIVSRIRVITHLRGRIAAPGRTPAPGSAPRSSRPMDLVAIGASTGGPGALVEVLRALPPTFSTPITIVLHIGEKFGHALADWLDGQTNRRVAFAMDGVRVSELAGKVVLAPPERHLVVRDRKLAIVDDKPRHSCKPSVDVMFESVAREYGANAVGVLLTGMGRDGASGLLDMKHAGSLTIAQDEATSVIYGMPKEAVALGAADRVLPLDAIGPSLAQLHRTRNEATS